jgi:20S proteasome alpha/beta subunit
MNRSMIGSRQLVLISIVLVSCLLSPLVVNGQSITQEEMVPESHGTVNIVFANDNGLVAVVDSMLTFELPNGEAGHRQDATKLFKIDDRTICTMAGLYAFPGALDIQALTAMFPFIVSHYTKTVEVASKEHPLSFFAKVELLQHVFMSELRTSLEAFLAYNPTFVITRDQMIVLSLAGYDLDGQLKLTEFTLKPVTQGNSVFFDVFPWGISNDAPACERFGREDGAFTDGYEQSRIIGGGLSCEVVGVPEIANDRLAHPQMYPSLPALQVFAKAGRTGRSLTTTEMRALALELEKETAEDEKKKKTEYVGGNPKVAVLSGGRLTEEPPAPPLEFPVGDALIYALPKAPFNDIRMNCGVASQEGSQLLALNSLHSMVQAKVTIHNCGQVIDGILFHDSLFVDSILTYLGDGPIMFAHSNVIDGSTLIIGWWVNLDSPAVKDIVCYFPWKSVKRYGDEKPIERRCK